MRPRQFDNSNGIIGPPPDMRDNCNAIACYRGKDTAGTPLVITKWFPSEEELAALQAGEGVYLTCVGITMPPVIVGTEDPFLPLVSHGKED